MLIPKDKTIEHRIDYQIIVDTYDGEYAMCWYYYLQNTLNFPFNAKDKENSSAKVLDEEECSDGMYVYYTVTSDS